MTRKTTILWVVIGLAAVAGVAIPLLLHRWRPRPMTIQGAVLRYDTDVRKESPVSDVLVTASRGGRQSTAQSGVTGYFKVTLPEVVWPGQVINLRFSRSGYQPIEMPIQVHLRTTRKELFVVRMKPTVVEESEATTGPATVVSNVKIRYTVNAEKEENIGSAVKTFVVANRGDVPCQHQAPCSPDGSWKAATGSVTLDAGAGNAFRNARVSCIAGPCPFTKIDRIVYEERGRTITASVIDWSDTTTFLLEAEVFRTSIVSNVHESYPVIFGQTLHFTLPPTQEGLSIEAEVDGTPMVFPLGPDLFLSWATCVERANSDKDKSTVYQCELKPGYKF